MIKRHLARQEVGPRKEASRKPSSTLLGTLRLFLVPFLLCAPPTTRPLPLSWSPYSPGRGGKLGGAGAGGRDACGFSFTCSHPIGLGWLWSEKLGAGSLSKWAPRIGLALQWRKEGSLSKWERRANSPPPSRPTSVWATQWKRSPWGTFPSRFKWQI